MIKYISLPITLVIGLGASSCIMESTVKSKC